MLEYVVEILDDEASEVKDCPCFNQCRSCSIILVSLNGSYGLDFAK